MLSLPITNLTVLTMNTSYTVSLSTHTKTMTAIVTAIIAVTCICVIIYETVWGYAIASIVALIMALSAAFTPRKLIITDDSLIIKRVLGKKTITKADIKRVSRVDGEKISLVRVCGVGGFFGYTGWFYNKTLGKVFLYVGDFKRTVLLTTHSAKTYMLSCDNPEAVVDELR